MFPLFVLTLFFAAATRTNAIYFSFVGRVTIMVLTVVIIMVMVVRVVVRIMGRSPRTLAMRLSACQRRILVGVEWRECRSKIR